ncbi:hypothetical protein Tco_1285065 [Tanacetum coccineum]
MDDNLFTYELGVVENFYFLCVEQSYDEGNLNIHEAQWLDLKYGDHKTVDKEFKDSVISTWLITSYKKQFDEYMEIKRQLEVRGDDEEVLTEEEFYDLGKENMNEENEIAKIFRIETDIFHFRTPLCKAFKEFNYLFQIDVDVLLETYRDLKHLKITKIHGSMNGTKKSHGLRKNHEYWWVKKEEEESSDDAWSHYSPVDEWKDYEHTTYIETNVISNQNTYNNVCQIFKDHAGMTNDDATNGIQEWFDERESMEEDDNVGDLDNYLMPSDAPYYVNEEDERFKARRSKLLGIPYKKPSTFKSEKFKVIKYSLGPAEEYVAIKEHEYDIWLRTKKNVSQVYEEIFHKKDEGWFVTRTT